MFSFLLSNLSTIIISCIVIIIVAIIVKKMIKDKKNGKGACNGNCAKCQNSKIHYIK
ncbi:MAG: FeoB-associated Cys-rich membrane protein [Clostridia bacterium]|nr:FeoB-associated Cys-rich membrane protein [Clostridia bacterium]